jgi:hypothetical protein
MPRKTKEQFIEPVRKPRRYLVLNRKKYELYYIIDSDRKEHIKSFEVKSTQNIIKKEELITGKTMVVKDGKSYILEPKRAVKLLLDFTNVEDKNVINMTLTLFFTRNIVSVVDFIFRTDFKDEKKENKKKVR